MSGADRQHQLLEVALNAFSRRGFKGTTTKEIASAAGVAEAVIFQHFPSKEALYSAVLELHLETGDEQSWIEEVSDFMERNDDEGVFRSFILRILNSYSRDPLIQRVILTVPGIHPSNPFRVSLRPFNRARNPVCGSGRA